MRFRLFFGAVAVVVGLIALPASSAVAKLACNGVYTHMTLSGGVVVPSGDTCVLENDTVTGGLLVEGGSISVTDSNIGGGWVVNNGIFPTYQCGDNTSGGLVVENINTNSTFAYGEVDVGCAGGTVTGGVKIINNNPGVGGGSLEIDGTTVGGGFVDTNNNAILNEVEGLTVTGGATCANNTTPAVNDGDGGPSTYSGGNHGCP